MMTNDLFSAVCYAIEHHKDQKRKYTGVPYVVHPVAVAKMLDNMGFSQDVVIAGLFHDLIEDTPLTINDIEKEWGMEVAALVEMVTDISVKEDGNRAKRKELDRAHLATASMEGQSIKCADLIDNAKDIVKNDPTFARVYLPEMLQTLGVLSKARLDIWKLAHETWFMCSAQLELDTSD